VLRSIQRFGRLGKRSGNVPPEARHSKDKIKEAKYMYLSIDEAGTHVNVRRFRCPLILPPSHIYTQPKSMYSLHTSPNKCIYTSKILPCKRCLSSLDACPSK
jgi:hypothetical protein